MAFERALMEGEMDVFDFLLAEKLGMTLADIGQMANREYIAWRAFNTYRSAMKDFKSKKGGT